MHLDGKVLLENEMERISYRDGGIISLPSGADFSNVS